MPSGVRLTASAFVEGALARRPVEPGLDMTRTAVDPRSGLRVQDANIELVRGRTELVAGLGRVVWGRLDEIQPTDVINPLDVSRFFFEGRSEARLPVALVRGRFFLNADSSIEAIYVPVFRRGRFDRIDEPTAPFAIDAPAGIAVCLAIGCPVLPVEVVTEEPSVQPGQRPGRRENQRDDLAGGLERLGVPRVRAVRALRGGPVTTGRATILGSHPRFTMIGNRFRDRAGRVGHPRRGGGLREDTFQSPDSRRSQAHSLDAGVGVDRKAGRLSDQRHGAAPSREPTTHRSAGGSTAGPMSRLFAADRSSRANVSPARVHRRQPHEGSGFARVIAAAGSATNVALEGSSGWFVGSGPDTDRPVRRQRLHLRPPQYLFDAFVR